MSTAAPTLPRARMEVHLRWADRRPGWLIVFDAIARRAAWHTAGMRPQFSVFIAASLDGFIAKADGNIDWLQIHSLDKEPNGYDEFIGSIDAIVIGRGTYETVLGFGGWFYGGKRVIVMTHGKREPRHGEEFYAGDPKDLLPRLAGAKRVYVDGGNVIAQFFAADLIDDVTVGILPIVLGGGIRLFPGEEGEQRLVLERHRVYDSGMVQLGYRVRRLKDE